MNEKTIHQIGRIDQIVRDFFVNNPSINTELAKNLMPLFIQKGIFTKDQREGKPMRDILREMDKENALHLLHHCHVVRKAKNRSWYFERK